MSDTTTDPRYATFGKSVWQYIVSQGGGFCGQEISEDILPLAAAAGLCRRERYDPKVHGEIEADPGCEIWFWCDVRGTNFSSPPQTPDPDALWEEAAVAFAESHEFPDAATEHDREAWMENWVREKMTPASRPLARVYYKKERECPDIVVASWDFDTVVLREKSLERKLAAALETIANQRKGIERLRAGWAERDALSAENNARKDAISRLKDTISDQNDQIERLRAGWADEIQKSQAELRRAESLLNASVAGNERISMNPSETVIEVSSRDLFAVLEILDAFACEADEDSCMGASFFTARLCEDSFFHVKWKIEEILKSSANAAVEQRDKLAEAFAKWPELREWLEMDQYIRSYMSVELESFDAMSAAMKGGDK